MLYRKITAVLASCALLAMAVFVKWQVFTRYFTSSASIISEEAVRFALVLLTFMGGAYCFATGQHIAIDLFAHKRGAAWRAIFQQFASLFYAALLAVGMGYLAWQQRLQRLSALNLSMGVVYGTVALAALFMVFSLLNKGLLGRKGQKG